MCGIAGLLVPPGKLDGDELSRLAARMAATVRHRGRTPLQVSAWRTGGWP